MPGRFDDDAYRVRLRVAKCGDHRETPTATAQSPFHRAAFRRRVEFCGIDESPAVRWGMGKCLVCVALLALACSQKEQAKPKPTSQQDAPSHSSQPIAPAPATPPPAAAQTASSANAEEIFAALERFKDEMCACEDAKCAEGVSDGKMRWLQTKARRAGYPAKLTAEEGARADAIDEAIRKCEETAFDAVPPRKK